MGETSGGRKFCITFWEGSAKSTKKRSEDRVDFGDNTGQVLVIEIRMVLPLVII